MKYFSIFAFTAIFGITITNSFAQGTKADFDKQQGVLSLPEVNIIPANSSYTATLRQLDKQEFILELDTVVPIESSVTHYDPVKNILYIPSLTIDKQTYKQIQLELIANSAPPRFRMLVAEVDKKATKSVVATVETKPVSASGDAADDPAIWIHPHDPTLSTILGTQKQGGIGVYDLTGKEIQFLKDGDINNIDLRYNFSLDNEKITIVAASNRSNDSIVVYKINPTSRHLEKVAARTLTVELKYGVYGFCMYQSAKTGKYYAFINDKSGAVEQWELFDNGNKRIDAKLVRTLKAASQVEGCVADDDLGYFYLSEEKVGIWKFGAEPDSGNEGHLIDTVDKTTGNLLPELEGLSIYYLNDTEGYLLASNQGSSLFTVHNRAGNNEYLGQFQIITNETLNIDNVNDTDGIDVTNVSLGTAFPYGIFVTQDGENSDPDENQNFKIVPWEQIADALGLRK